LEKFTLRHSMTVPDTLILRFFSACRNLSYVALEDYIAPSEQLVLGIVAKVREEIAIMQLKRKLPIQLWIPLGFNLEKLFKEVSVANHFIYVGISARKFEVKGLMVENSSLSLEVFSI